MLTIKPRHPMKIYTKILYITIVASALTTQIQAGWWSDIVTTMSNSESYKKIQKWTKDHPTATKIIAGTALATSAALAAYKAYSIYVNLQGSDLEENNLLPDTTQQPNISSTTTFPVVENNDMGWMDYTGPSNNNYADVFTAINTIQTPATCTVTEDQPAEEQPQPSQSYAQTHQHIFKHLPQAIKNNPELRQKWEEDIAAQSKSVSMEHKKNRTDLDKITAYGFILRTNLDRSQFDIQNQKNDQRTKYIHIRGKSKTEDFTDAKTIHYFTPTDTTNVADIAYALLPHLDNTKTMRFFLQLVTKTPSFAIESDNETDIQRLIDILKEQKGLTYNYSKKNSGNYQAAQKQPAAPVQKKHELILNPNGMTTHCTNNNIPQETQDMCCEFLSEGGVFLYHLACGTATPQQVREAIKKLAQSKLSKNETITEKERQCYLMYLLVGAAWFCYAEELNTGTTEHGFKEGTFILEDDNESIYNAFHEYLNILKDLGLNIEQGKIQIQGLSIPCTAGTYIQNQFGGYRVSSHPGEQQFGIDVVDNQGNDLPLLPTGKLHLLVSKITLDNGKKLTLFKMENYGIHKPEHLKHHGAEFVTAQATKNATLRWMFGLESDDAETNKKERVPEEVRKKIAELTQKFPNMNEETKKLLAKTAKTSIANTLVILQQTFAQENDVELKSALSRVIHYIKTEFNNATKRMGNEVFITREDILVSGYYYHLLATKNFKEAALYKPIAESFNALRKQITIAEKNKAEVSEECLNNARTFVKALQAFSAIQNDALYTYLINIAAIIKASEKQQNLKSFLTSDLFVKENQDITLNVLGFQEKALDAGNAYLEEVKKADYAEVDYSIPGELTSEEQKKYDQFIAKCQEHIGTETTPLHFDTIRTLLPETAKTDFKNNAQDIYKSVFATISTFSQSQNPQKKPIVQNIITKIEKAYSKYVGQLIVLAQQHKLFTGRAQGFDGNIFDYYYKLLKKQCNAIYKSWSPDANSLEKEDYKKAYAKLQTQLRIILASFQNHLALWKTYDECQQGFANVHKGIMTTLNTSFPTFDAVTQNAQQDMTHKYIKKLMELRTKYNQKNLSDSWVTL